MKAISPRINFRPFLAARIVAEKENRTVAIDDSLDRLNRVSLVKRQPVGMEVDGLCKDRRSENQNADKTQPPNSQLLHFHFVLTASGAGLPAPIVQLIAESLSGRHPHRSCRRPSTDRAADH